MTFLETFCRVHFFFLMIRRPPSSPLFPYATLSQSRDAAVHRGELDAVGPVGAAERRDDRAVHGGRFGVTAGGQAHAAVDRKSTRLNSSHSQISYAVFCLEKNTYLVLRGGYDLLGTR